MWALVSRSQRSMLGMCAWVALGALGCGGEPAVHADVEDVADSSEDVAGDTAEEARDTAPETTLADTPDTPDTIDTPDTRDTTDAIDTRDTTEVDTSAVPDTDTPDTAEVDTTDLPDTVPDTTDITDTTEVVPDTTPDVSPDTHTPLCPATTTTYPVLLSPYAPVCSELSFATDPPTSGPHYPVWATYKTYNVQVNPGFLVHSLKHGAIVITWRCPDGCLDELVELREMLNRRPADRRCDPLLKHRIIVAPRSNQDTKLVASAWGASWKAPCFDLVALEAFIDAHYGQGLEDECFEGVDVEKVRSDSAWYCPP